MEFKHQEDFILFLFLHLACVDGGLHPNEKETILEQMTGLFPDQPPYDSRLTELELLYKKIGSANAELSLTDQWPRFSSMDQDQKAKLYPILFDIINSDARVNEEETRLLKILKGWLAP